MNFWSKNMYKKKICQEFVVFLDDMIEELKILNKSENYLMSYNQTIKALIEFLSEYDRNFNLKNPGSIKTGLIKFLKYKSDNLQKHADSKKSSQILYLQHIKSFFEFIQMSKGEDYKLKEIFSKLKIKPQKREPKQYSEKNLDDLFAVLENKIEEANNYNVTRSRAKSDKSQLKRRKQFIAYRDSFIIKVYLNSGLRDSELLVPKLKDFYLSEDNIIEFEVTGKGNKVRTCYLLHSLVKRELEWFRDNNIKNALVSINNKALDRVQIWKLIKRRLHEANIYDEGCIHKLRHTFAKHIYAKTKDISTIKEMLGHESITTTSIYTQEGKETTRKNYKFALEN